jgi:hypothetical protein
VKVSGKSGQLGDPSLSTTEWRPYRERIRTTLIRAVSIAVVAAALVSAWAGGISRWPILSLFMLWPAFGGHWVDLWFLNWLRPRLPSAPLIQRAARVAVWFGGGGVLALGIRLTATLLHQRVALTWLTWAPAGVAFVGIELLAHAVLAARGRPSFFNGLG